MARLLTLIAGGWALADSTWALWYAVPVHPIAVLLIGVALVWDALSVHKTDLF